MEKIVLLVVFIVTSSCGLKFVRFNNANDKIHAEKVGNEYFKSLEINNRVIDYKLVSVENTKLYMGKNNDTLKEVYEMIYDLKENGQSNSVLFKIVKRKSNFKVKSKTIK